MFDKLDNGNFGEYVSESRQKMPQPTRYAPAYDFSDFQSNNPSDPLPGDRVDIELGALDLTTDEIIDNLALIQRDDGALRNSLVTIDSLSSAARSLFALGGTVRGPWATGTAYVVGDVVSESDKSYLCVVAHTSGTFSTDLAADRWVLVGAGGAALDAFGALVPAADRVPYFTGADSAALATLTAYARSLLGSADAAAARSTLGLQAALANLTTAEITQLLNINATTISAAQWGFLGALTAAPAATDLSNVTPGSVTAALLGDNAVTTSKIASNNVTLAKLANGSAGQVISYDGTNAPVAVAAGTTGQVLTANTGAAPSFQTLPTGAPVPTGLVQVGQFKEVITALGAAWSLPSGGTWAYSGFRVTNSGTFDTNVSGVAAGSTQVGQLAANTRWRGFEWRVA